MAKLTGLDDMRRHDIELYDEVVGKDGMINKVKRQTIKGGLIYDQGKLRDCQRNRAKLGYLKSYWSFYSLKKSTKHILGQSNKAFEAAHELISFLFYLLILPIVPFLTCFLEVRRAKRLVKDEERTKSRYFRCD